VRAPGPGQRHRLAASDVNAQIKSLARVLNAVRNVSSFGDRHDGRNHPVHGQMATGRSWVRVFAGAERSGGNATFSIPCGGYATATVLGEHRTLSVGRGSFADASPPATRCTSTGSTRGSSCGPT
jgi:hypothetical protein